MNVALLAVLLMHCSVRRLHELRHMQIEQLSEVIRFMFDASPDPEQTRRHLMQVSISRDLQVQVLLRVHI